ncbi:MAG: hypothetical protein M1832_004604 [Thelocarpon impressellum]|nr:MAG: hypothetical protein M1832_004604 [Thelocarpon impressellum]
MTSPEDYTLSSPKASDDDLASPWVAGEPPPLPPRAGTIHLTPYSKPSPSPAAAAGASHNTNPRRSWTTRDPRSSSTQSLLPADSASGTGRRTLLLIYIHGFLGNEASFQSFPAHVHNLLTITLAESHVVHTKIYPRYKSRKPIEHARDDFSNWLAPHESPTTDVVLLGHSMGGLLSAEVVLLPPRPPARDPLRHLIVGTVNFDTPFLGMHPGIVVSGISSLFRPADTPETAPATAESATARRHSVQGMGFDDQLSHTSTASSAVTTDSHGTPAAATRSDSTSLTPALTSSSVDTDSMYTRRNASPLATPPATDANYNPPFPNDVRIPMRSGWNNAVHFLVKHSDDLTKATRQYVTSHLEFGGCLADFAGLKARYARLRALENVDRHNPRGARRVRFVNYYTASTGRPKKGTSPARNVISGPDAERRRSGEALSVQQTRSASQSPRISVEEHSDEGIMPRQLDDGEPVRLAETEASDLADAAAEMALVAPDTVDLPADVDRTSPASRTQSNTALPPVPPLPRTPPPPEPSAEHSPDALKLLQKDHVRALKAHARAVKDHARAVRDRQKVLDKRAKQREKALRQEGKRARAEEADGERARGPGRAAENRGQGEGQGKKPARDKKFCLLPSKDAAGARDPAWVRVYMPGVDEVGAHCGLFFAGGAQYETLVGDVGERIERWVRASDA